MNTPPQTREEKLEEWKQIQDLICDEANVKEVRYPILTENGPFDLVYTRATREVCTEPRKEYDQQ